MNSQHISNREREILQLIAFENSSKEIAQQLFISEHTVITHRKNLLHKMEVKNTAGLVRKGFEYGILQLRHSFIVFFLMTSLMFLVNSGISGQCHPDDFTALKALYQSTNGDNWTDTTGWSKIKNSSTCPDGFDLSSINCIAISNDRVRFLKIIINT